MVNLRRLREDINELSQPGLINSSKPVTETAVIVAVMCFLACFLLISTSQGISQLTGKEEVLMQQRKEKKRVEVVLFGSKNIDVTCDLES